MKKIYSFIIAFAFIAGAQSQIIDDDFESYDLGQIGAANTDVWSVWSGTPTGPSAEDLTISDVETSSGDRSGFIGPGPGPQDVMLLLGNLTSGDYTLVFNMFIPTGKTGYFNIQGLTEGGGAGDGGMGVFNSNNIVFNNTESANGAPGLAGFYPNADDPDPTLSWAYPENEWFEISIYFDVSNIQYTMTVDGVDVETQFFNSDSVLGGIDFFAINENNEFYIDDVLFIEGALNTEDFVTNDFSVYPNPVQDILNIRTTTSVDSIQVYDVLGKLVIQKNPNIVSPTVDMSGLKSGVYFVRINSSEGISETIKVVK